ncbi:RTA-like protein [Pyrenochaeta sp. MPI-SDFR-AT-0127]|nr:RTA-like protein [Pyrenochaeta sp. MPI-SDFR-AT-0127]
MVYSRVVRAIHGEHFSLITPRWCTWFFVGGDLLCLNIQSTGAGFLPKPHLEKVGNGVIVAGLMLQVLIFAGFMYCCLLFHRNFRTHLAGTGGSVNIPWESVLNMLYGTSVIISIRNIFRLVEFIAGHDSYLFKNEWPVYVFDGVLMLVIMIVFYIWYPPQLQDGQTDSGIEPTGENVSADIDHVHMKKYSEHTS